MTKERFTTPTSNPTFPPTLENCDQDPSKCPFMNGVLLEGTMYNASCGKSLLNLPQVEVAVDGWNLPITINTSDIEKVMCGRCHPISGVKREV